MYNGLTCDWHDIKVSEGELSRLKTSRLKEFIVMEDFQKRGLPFPDKSTIEVESKKLNVKPNSWEFNQYAADADLYNYKKVSLISGKFRGKTFIDRLGSVEY
jgi:hypothetical protein